MTYKRIRNDDFTLICNYGSCSFTEHFDNNEEAFKKGWRMNEDGHICPQCMDKRNEKESQKVKPKITIATDSSIDDNALYEKGEKMFNEVDRKIKEYFPTCTILGQIEIMKYGFCLVIKWKKEDS